MRINSFILFSIFLLFSCSDEVTKKLENLPRALGKSNEIIVVCDQVLWDGPLGDTIMYYFESAYPIMPSPEPLFDLRHFTFNELEEEPLRKELRTYLIVSNISDTDSKVTQMVRRDMGEERFRRAEEDSEYNSSVGKDKWARGQLLVYLFSKSDDALAQNIRESFPAVAQRVNAHDANQIKSSAYVSGVNKAANDQIQDHFKIDMQIPADYVVAKEDYDNQLVWLRKDSKEATLNIVIERINYSSQEQFSSAEAKKLINDFGQKYISSPEVGSYLQINDEDLPMFEYNRRISDSYTKEVRGIWEMVNDFMGGPFAAYMIHDSTRNEVLFINTFIYAPGQDKRNLMQELDHVVKSAKINS